MNKQEFYQDILESFFDETEWELSEFIKMVSRQLHIYGEAGYDISEDENGSVITILDRDMATVCIGPENVQIEEESLEMTTVALQMRVDCEGYIIEIIKDNKYMTKTNKYQSLFLLSLLGKRIIKY